MPSLKPSSPRWRLAFLTIFVAQLSAALSACGGGGGGADAAGTAPASQVKTVACRVGDLSAATAPAVNLLRTSAQSCGGVQYPAVPTVAWDARLAQAAERHGTDMAINRFFDHTGSDGSSVGTRVTASGYAWTVVAENLASGQSSLNAALAAWLASTGHCQNLMKANVTDVGLACVKREGDGQPYLWTLVLARP
ncbi:MAG: CAP domain-containing protein [Hydrogenophaga sp.]|uniref:CAP domain-containing protein n=1 Tax=Hydrogenophaga sp. TaxID=1904254 RepID=UPI001D852773|nr:CAP domain-containing protein [Hydrogenophaga sp.]MBX3611179.1 CAP domain-containing protein [Hydrogenophaga sp.]